MDFRDAGKELGGTPVMPADYPTEKYYPSIHIDFKDFPELNKGIGEEFEVTIKCKVTSKNISEDGSSGSIEICSFGFEEEKPEEESKLYPTNEADRELHKMKNRRSR